MEMDRLYCPYLGGEVELSRERERHIAERHPELLPEHRALIVQTLDDPDQVRLSSRHSHARLFTRWFHDLRCGKYVVVVVVSQIVHVHRHWVVTAYITRKISEGAVEWKKD